MSDIANLACWTHSIGPCGFLLAWTSLFAWTGFAKSADPSTSDVNLWPQFRGVNAAGVAAERVTIPSEFGPDLNVRWKTVVPTGASSPCVWRQHVFVTGFGPDPGTFHVYSLDRDDGTVVWKRSVTSDDVEKVHHASTPATATVATDGERLFVYFGSVGLRAYDFVGNELWTVDLPVPRTRNGSGTSPIVAGNLVLLNRDQPRDAGLYAFDKTNGDRKWVHPYQSGGTLNQEGYSTPIVFKDQVIVHTHLGVRCISLKEGELIWSVNTATTGCSTPVIWRDRLLVATWENLGEPDQRREIPGYQELLENDADQDGSISFDEFPAEYKLFDRPEASDEGAIRMSLKQILSQIDANGDKKVSMLEWMIFNGLYNAMLKDHGLLSIRLGGQGDVTGSHVEFLTKQHIPEVPSPLAYRDKLYLIKNGGILTRIDLPSGQEEYRKRIGTSGSYYASPVGVGPYIVFASRSGVITLVAADGEFKVESKNDLDEKILATPAMVGDTLLVRTENHIYAFAAQSGSD